MFLSRGGDLLGFAVFSHIQEILKFVVQLILKWPLLSHSHDISYPLVFQYLYRFA